MAAVTEPTPVPVGSAKPGAKPFPPGGPGAPAAGARRFLATPGGKLTAAGGVVAAFALYRRHQAAGAGAGAANTSPQTAGSTAGYTADTSGQDAYNALEPLIENLSGFSGTAAIQQQLDQNQAALLAAINAGKGTPPAGGVTAKPPGPNQIEQPVTARNLYNEIIGRYKGASGQQIAQIAYNTINAPENARWKPQLSQGIIPAYSKITFISAPVK